MPRHARDPQPRGAAPGPEPSPTAPPPFSHGALFAAVRSGDSAAARALLAQAEASGASLAALAGETATHVAADAGREEVVRLILSLNEFMASTITARVDLAGVQSHIDIGTTPCFDGTDYATWKWMMKIYLTAMHPSIWWIVERGYSVKDTDSPATKQQNEHKNALAASAILSGLSPNERNKVYGLETAKQIWDRLQLAHEGTPCVRELKIELLMEKLGRFVMEKGETPNEMYNRLIRIVNEIKGLGSKEMTDNFVVKRMVRAIAPRNPALATNIREQEDFAKLTPHDVLGRVHDLIDQSSSSKKKYLAPESEDDEESSSEEESEDEVELYHKFLHETFNRPEKSTEDDEESSSEEESEDDVERYHKFLHETFNRPEKSKESHSKRSGYECGETGHFMANCPNKKNKSNDEKRKENHNKKNKSKSLKKSQKGQSVIGVEWDSNDSSTESDDENVHMCLSGFQA